MHRREAKFMARLTAIKISRVAKIVNLLMMTNRPQTQKRGSSNAVNTRSESVIIY